MSEFTVRSHGVTDPGPKRKLNEDSFLDRPDLGLWAVADGVGGAEAGEVASAAVCNALGAIPAGLAAAELLAAVRDSLHATHKALLAMAEARRPGASIASTAAVLILAGRHFACVWAGDSRVYLLHDGVLRQLTWDHSLVQGLVDQGVLTPAEAERHPRANVITRAIGAGGAELELDKVTGEVRAGDRFLLCSDGLSKTLDDAELAAVLAMPAGVSAAEMLVTSALAREASDNVTAVMVGVEVATSRPYDRLLDTPIHTGSEE